MVASAVHLNFIFDVKNAKRSDSFTRIFLQAEVFFENMLLFWLRAPIGPSETGFEQLTRRAFDWRGPGVLLSMGNSSKRLKKTSQIVVKQSQKYVLLLLGCLPEQFKTGFGQLSTRGTRIYTLSVMAVRFAEIFF